MTIAPAHAGFADADTETLTGKRLFTVVVIGLETAGLPMAQASFEVTKQVMTSPFNGTYTKVLLFDPALLPFTFHSKEGADPALTGVAVYVTGVPEQT